MQFLGQNVNNTDIVISAGVEALSLYGQHFFEQLAELEAQCDRARHQTLTSNTS